MPLLIVNGCTLLCGNKLCPFCRAVHLLTSEVVDFGVPLAHGYSPAPRFTIDDSKVQTRYLCGGVTQIQVQGHEFLVPTGSNSYIFTNSESPSSNVPTIYLPAVAPPVTLNFAATFNLCDNCFCTSCNGVPALFSRYFMGKVYSHLRLPPPTTFHYITVPRGWKFHCCGGKAHITINKHSRSFDMGQLLPDFIEVDIPPRGRPNGAPQYSP